MELCGHHVVGHEVVYRNGCFTRERFYLHGWVKAKFPGWVSYTHGWTGPETVVTIETIKPLHTFEISES
jgi:hypothetical protein